MSISKEAAVEKARQDVAHRTGVQESDITEESVDDADFPDTALGAATDDEMSGQMITRGWRIRLKAKGQTFEYRADKNQVRLHQYKGKNHRI